MTGRVSVRQLVGTMELGCRAGRSPRPTPNDVENNNLTQAEKIFSAEVQLEPRQDGPAGKKFAQQYALNFKHPKLTLGYDERGSRATVRDGVFPPASRHAESRPDDTDLSVFAEPIRDVLESGIGGVGSPPPEIH